MKTDFFALYDAIAHGVKSDEAVSLAARGELWTMAETASSLGIAMTTPGDSIAPMYPGGIEGMGLSEAARAVKSWNLTEAGFGLAAANAYYNTPRRLEELKCYEPFDNYCTDGLELRGKTVALIGHLKGPRDLQALARKVYIIERSPQEGDYPDSACDYILPQCDLVIITASSIVNKTLPHLLELCGNACTILTGPSAPMCPELLELGFDRIAGMVVTDRERMRPHVRQSTPGTPYIYGRPFLLKK